MCLIAMSAWASKTVNGKVVSAVDNEPLIGATIQAVGSSQGTATDINGEFTVTVNDNVTQLTISCVGYKTKIVPVTTYVTVSLEEDNTLLDVIVNEDSPRADKTLVNESLSREIDRALSTLSDREKQIVEMFFGINHQEMTLEEIGDRFNLTRERVRQIKEKAIRRLRNNSKNKILKSFLG